MTVVPEAICPLCSQVRSRAELHESILAEDPRVRRRTIQVIQSYHPGWAEDDGACESCWRSYRDASRILDVMKSTKAPDATGSGKPLRARVGSANED